MTAQTRHLILRANALYLGIAAAAGLVLMDLRGIYFDAGPASRILNDAPHTAIGFVEAHGLAFILAVLFWRAAPERSWHVTAMATTALLGTANLVFWQIFIASDALAMGYLTTSLHWTFALAQLVAAIAATSPGASQGAELEMAFAGRDFTTRKK